MSSPSKSVSPPPIPIFQDVAITGRRPTPSTPWFFDWIFDSLEYRQWKDKSNPTRLLRLVGGPGSGKTSFATLAVRQLQQQDNVDTNLHSRKPSIVLSVFLESLQTSSPGAAVAQEQNNVPFSIQFLADIERQLDVALKLDSIPTPPTSPQDQTIEAIISNIQFKLHRFSDVYLIIDDIDCLWVLPEECIKIELQLEALRSHGVRVLVTSRTAFRTPTTKVQCDVDLSHHDEERAHDPEQENDDDDGLVTWWSCGHEDHENQDDDDDGDGDDGAFENLDDYEPHSHENLEQLEVDELEDDFGGSEAEGCENFEHFGHHQEDDSEDDEEFSEPQPTLFVICSNCKAAGFGCGHSSHPPPVMNTRPVILHMSDIPRSTMESFIVHHLQLEHGHFWDMPLDPSPFDRRDLGAPKRMYPPLSPLGKRLVSTVPDQPSGDAYDLVGRVANLCHNNMTVALLRLELAHQAENLDQVFRTGDRLPPNIVHMLDGLFSRQVHSKLGEGFPDELRVRAALALHAVRLVGNRETIDGMRCKKLKRDLLKEDEKCGHGFKSMLEGELWIEELLGAAGGLLAFDPVGRTYVKCFHQSFHKYVKERYNEFLASRQCGRTESGKASK